MGRCDACYQWRWRYGFDRPEEVIVSYARRQLQREQRKAVLRATACCDTVWIVTPDDGIERCLCELAPFHGGWHRGWAGDWYWDRYNLVLEMAS